MTWKWDCMLLWPLRVKKDFIPLAYPSLTGYAERKVLRWHLQGHRCCRWHLGTLDQRRGIRALCSPDVHTHFLCGRTPGGKVSPVCRCAKPRAAGQGGVSYRWVYLPVSAQNWSKCRGEPCKFPVWSRRGNCGMWLLGLSAAPGGNWTYQIQWGHKSSWFAAFREVLALMCLAEDFHPSGSASLWSPPQHCDFSRNVPMFCWKFTKPHFLTEISSSLRAKGFVANSCTFG